MTVVERLIALRADWSPTNALWARKQSDKGSAHYWAMNALSFEWHREPPWYAVASFKYAESLRQKRAA